MTEKRQRLELTLAGEVPECVPTSLWRYWPGDDQRAADFAQATIDFQQAYDWDFVRLMPFSAYSVADYGATTSWQPALHGDRTLTKRPISRSLLWTELRPLDPLRGELGKHLASVEIIRRELPDVPLLATIYSPLAQAQMLGDKGLALRNMRTHATRLQTGLNALTETTLRFIELLTRAGIDGLFYVIDAADYTLMTKEEYVNFGLQYDRRIMDALPAKWWFRALDLRGAAPMFEFMSTYPINIIHWDSANAHPDMNRARTIAPSLTLAAGLDHEAHLHMGTPMTIGEIVRGHINDAEGRRLILTAGDVLPVSTPHSNMRAVREAVNLARRVV